MLVTSLSDQEIADHDIKYVHRPVIPIPQSNEIATGLVPLCSQGPSVSVSQSSNELPYCDSTYEKPLPQVPASPSKSKVLLRDLVMFLIIANICLWLLTTLEGIAFTIYPYQNFYFGNRVWLTVTMIAAPLSIFFRLHSAVCFFKIWSYV